MQNDRILLLHWGQTGAGPKLLLELAKALTEVVSPEQVAVSFNEKAELASQLRELPCTQQSVRTYDRNNKSFVVNAVRIPILRRDLRDFIKREEVTSVYSVMGSPYQNLSLVPLFQNPFRYVETIHDAVPHDGDRSIFSKASTRTILEKADHVVTLSHHVTNLLEKSYNVDPGRLSTLFHPAWDGREVTARSSPPKDRAVRIGFFGRLLPYKGIRMLLDALRILRSQGYNVEAVIHGSGPEGRLAAEYRDVAPNWEPRWIDDNDIPALLAEMDILALPYLEASQSGVMAYALTAGIPVVGTPTGGLIEQISETNSGIIAESITSDAFAQALACLIDDAVGYARYSRHALAAANDSYSWRSFAQQLLPILTG